MNLKKVDEIIKNYKNNDSWLVMILQDVQEKYNYLPVEAIKRVAEKLQIPLSRVFNVATFYSSLSLAERGKHVIKVCDGTACHLRGFTNLRDEITRKLGIKENETTEDKEFTLEVVACLGACALAPVMSIDNKCYGKINNEKVNETLDCYKRAAK
ncbi:MAG: NADH-quinone oxidoreductase subunit NuoE [Actinobacteria bacterium]|nr:NADH-quinone oxidoreductase subunit NuoE [Actinomycetota bacterium]